MQLFGTLRSLVSHSKNIISYNNNSSKINFSNVNVVSLSLRCRMMSTNQSNDKDQSIVIDNQTINYLKVGTGKHNVLALPGALGSIRSDFGPQIDGFDRDKFTLVTWDPPGYGHSRPPNRDFSPGFFHRDSNMAFKLMNSLGITKFSCLGWSDGGITSLIMAATKPDIIEKIVVWGSNAYVTKDDIQLYENIRDLSKWSIAMKTPLIELYTEEGLSKLWNDWCDAFQHIYKHEDGNICKDLLANIVAPTYIIHGVKDPLVPMFHPQYLKDNIKHVKYSEFKDGKHNLHLKYKTEFNAMVQEFLLSSS